MAESSSNRPAQRIAQPQRRAILDTRKKELLLMVMIRNRQAFNALREVLTPEHLSAASGGYGLIWSMTIDYFNTHGQLPEKEFLMAEVEDAYSSTPDVITEGELAIANEVLDKAFDPTTFERDVQSDRTYADWAVRIAQRYLEERQADKLKESIQTGTFVPVDMPAFLSTFQREAETIASLNANDASLAFDPGWDEEVKLDLTPTGFGPIDLYLGGGDTPGEVYGLLGPFGSCKTTMIYQLACERAKFYAKLKAEGGPHKMIVVCSYEARLKEMRQRSLGYTARILREHVEKMHNLADLSTSENLHPYERIMFRSLINSGQPVLGEQERAMDAIEMLNQHAIFLDMTGHTHQGRGSGSFKEIARWVNHECRRRGADVFLAGTVYIDYLGAMVKRHILANDLDSSQLRHLITGAGLEAKSLLADVFNVPVWLLHQLSGGANQMAEHVLADHTDSAESKSFAENLDFSFSIGRPSAQKLALFGCTKHRRQPPMENGIILVDGARNRVRDVNTRYTLDPSTKMIVDRRDVSRVRGEREPEHTSPASSTANEADLTGD